MNNAVFGVYDSSYEVARAINELESKGYSSTDIKVIANKKETMNFSENNMTDVEPEIHSHGDDSFFGKVERYFSNEKMHDIYAKLRDSGLSEIEIISYASDIEEGKIVVLLDLDAEEKERSSIMEKNSKSQSPGLKMMDRYNSGLGLANNPDPNLFVDEESARGTINSQGNHTDAFETNTDKKHGNKDEVD